MNTTKITGTTELGEIQEVLASRRLGLWITFSNGLELTLTREDTDKILDALGVK